MSKEKDIKTALIEQLKVQGKLTAYTEDLVSDYMEYWKLKRNLQKDIKKSGLRIEYVNGNGIKSVKPNRSIADMQKTTTLMLQILDKLGLEEPIVSGGADDYLS